MTAPGVSSPASDDSSQVVLPCTDLPVNIFAALARDGYIN
jgi:hypothetical protein